jgi:hypothetical protein
MLSRASSFIRRIRMLWSCPWRCWGRRGHGAGKVPGRVWRLGDCKDGPPSNRDIMIKVSGFNQCNMQQAQLLNDS